MKPVALVTGVVSDHRVEPFRILAEREDVEVLSWQEPRRFSQLEAARRAGSGRYRAVIAGLGGRVALPATYAAARRARIPFVLWASLWEHPRTPAHALSFLPMRAISRRADAVVTYGPHVSAFVQRRGARNVHVAPQAVDTAFWTAPATHPERPPAARFVALCVGRPARYKGTPELHDAWSRAGFTSPQEQLVLVGAGTPVGAQPPDRLRNFYAGSDVLVMPAIQTRDVLEPWGLVANEAMHQRLPVIATTAVGAAAGGLVRDERNGLVVEAGDAAALAAALRRLRDDAPLRDRLGTQAHADAAAYTLAAWGAGVGAALASVGAGKEGDR
jgi:glycosyltransferase involved in cell wall biosynthesis